MACDENCLTVKCRSCGEEVIVSTALKTFYSGGRAIKTVPVRRPLARCPVCLRPLEGACEAPASAHHGP